MKYSVIAISSIENSSNNFNVCESSLDNFGSGKQLAVFVTVNINGYALKM